MVEEVRSDRSDIWDSDDSSESSRAADAGTQPIPQTPRRLPAEPGRSAFFTGEFTAIPVAKPFSRGRSTVRSGPGSEAGSEGGTGRAAVVPVQHFSSYSRGRAADPTGGDQARRRPVVSGVAAAPSPAGPASAATAGKIAVDRAATPGSHPGQPPRAVGQDGSRLGAVAAVRVRPSQHWLAGYHTAVVIADFLMMALGCVLAFVFHVDGFFTVAAPHFPLGPAQAVAFVSLLWVVCLVLCGAHERHTMSEGYELYAKILVAVVIEFFSLTSVAFLTDVDFPRVFVIGAPLLGGLLTMVERWGFRRLVHRLRMSGGLGYATVLVGTGQGIRTEIEQFKEHPDYGFRPIAVCLLDRDETDDGLFEGFPVLHFDSRLASAAKARGGRVLLVIDGLARESTNFNALALSAEAIGLELAVNTSVTDVGAHEVKMKNVTSALPILSAWLPQYSFVVRAFKRLMDILGSFVGIVLGGLVMIPVAILIKREDGGPVFYKQERIGRYGVPFTLYKFRSMRVDAAQIEAALANNLSIDHGVTFKLKDDPRVTKVGKFIRKTSIDEFPQFFNVFRGTMSLVGPRPQQRYEMEQYNEIYSTRLLVKPGLTGPWQVSGRSDLSVEQAERLDVDYVENWSIMTDIAILLKTVVAVLRMRGSY